jgi:hypothetical protein
VMTVARWPVLRHMLVPVEVPFGTPFNSWLCKPV